MSLDLKSAYKGRKVCVTGGAGFIGSHLTRELVKQGAEVCVLDDFSNGLEENLSQIAGQIRLVRGSILDAQALASATDNIDLIFHEAAMTSVPGSLDDPEGYFEVNATGTLRVLQAACAAKARRVVFAASSSVYGDNPTLPKVESMPPEPMSPYAVAKCSAEYLLRAYAYCFDISTISLRYFNIFGPGQRPDSPYAAVIPKFAEAMLQGRKPVIYGDGSQTRDFTHVKNAVHANLLAGVSDKPLKGETVNVACGKSYDLLELVDLMARILDVSNDLEFAAPRIGEVQHSCASIALARELIGYEPVLNFKQGLQDALVYYTQVYGQASDQKSGQPAN